MALTVKASLNGSLPKTADLATVAAKFEWVQSLIMDFGTANGEADLVYADSGTISASGTQTFDLAGSLTAPTGAAAIFVEVSAIIVAAAPGNTNNVLVHGGSNPVPFITSSGTVIVRPGAFYVLTAPGAGVAVTASTGDIVTLANSSSGSSVAYDIFVVGRSA